MKGADSVNKKLSRLLVPGMTLYFLVLVGFSVVAFFFDHYYLAGGELVVTIGLFIYFKINSSHRKNEILKYLQSTTASLDSALQNELPLPMAIISITNNEIVWANTHFNNLTGIRATSFFNQQIDAVLPHLPTKWLIEGKNECPEDYVFQNRRYRIMGNQIHSEKDDPSMFLSSIYLIDQTELLKTRDEYIRSRPIVSIILIDNYDELINNVTDNDVSTMSAIINNRITAWAKGNGGLLRKIERNRYLFLFEAKDLPHFIEEKFSILDSVRSVTNSSGIPATVSLGIGKDGVSFEETYSFALLAIEMALSRGGDQAVLKDRYNFSFYGGHTKETERRTKIKSRVVANSLSELILQSSHVFIMGHKMADLDAVGAAAGVMCICRKQGKQGKIVINLQENAATSLISQLRGLTEYEGAFITDQDALLMADAKSLLIVVDTNRPDQVESKALLESMSRVVVIDHHRRAADYIEHAILNFHEPYVSSASELVTELLQYAVDPQNILPLEARALLAGIVLDTKNFGVRTGSSTFEAAAFLRRTGADPVEVKKLFQNDLEQTLSRYRIIQAARLYRGEIAIAALDFTANRTIAAQAADELLTISGITTSFVLYPDAERIIISARSIGDVNVQMVLEPLGGGGNAATAGAQIPGKEMNTVLTELVGSIDKYYES